MEQRADADFFSLADEKFDFDVSLSPASSKGGEEEDDEVFVGVVSHKELCISVGVESRAEAGEPDWSVLPVEQFENISQEAKLLANRLRSGGTDEAKEDFVQDAEAKLGVLSRATDALSPIKRETFCVQDSPMKRLPPAIQRQLLRGGAAAATDMKDRLSTSSPVRGAKSQPSTLLRGRAGLSVAPVLPSKLVPPTSCTKTRAPADRRSRPPPPSRAPPRPSSRTVSCDDQLSDSASVASDVSDSSLNSSLQGRRSLAPPIKSGLRNPSAVKAPPPQSRRVMDKRNTSSSSVSSFNSSLSVSPAAKGKLNTSVNSSVMASGARAPAGVSRPTNLSASASKPRRSTVAVPVAGAVVTRRSLSIQARKPSEVGRSTPLKPARVAPPAAPRHTPIKTAMERSSSLPSMPGSARLQTKHKPKAIVAPTPNGPIRGVSSPDPVRTMKPKRLISATNSPQRPSLLVVGHVTPPTGSRSLQCKARRASALPTPLSRRVSGIPTRTPGRPGPAPTETPDRPGPAPTETPGRPGPAPSETPSCDSGLPPAVVQPFSLEEAEPAAPSDAPDAGASPSLAGRKGNLIELQSAEGAEPQIQDGQKQEVIEVLLLDLPAPVLQPEEKLLIDLTNTPDLVRHARPCGAPPDVQLIDLSSPLIKWSPEDKKENGMSEAPLINLSF